jgi:hypothetical protein
MRRAGARAEGRTCSPSMSRAMSCRSVPYDVGGGAVGLERRHITASPPTATAGWCRLFGDRSNRTPDKTRDPASALGYEGCGEAAARRGSCGRAHFADRLGGRVWLVLGEVVPDGLRLVAEQRAQERVGAGEERAEPRPRSGWSLTDGWPGNHHAGRWRAPRGHPRLLNRRTWPGGRATPRCEASLDRIDTPEA